jgi:hypothetical protein
MDVDSAFWELHAEYTRQQEDGRLERAAEREEERENFRKRQAENPELSPAELVWRMIDEAEVV